MNEKWTFTLMSMSEYMEGGCIWNHPFRKNSLLDGIVKNRRVMKVHTEKLFDCREGAQWE